VGANLTDTDLSGASFILSDLSGAAMQRARLNGARVDLANFGGADMTAADLSGAQFSGAQLAGVNLTDTSLIDARFDVYSQAGNLLPTNLDGSVLRNAKLAGSFLAGASLAGADLSQADFSEDGSGPVVFASDRVINGQSVSLQADLAGANLSGANFRAADLSSANLEAADLSQANLRFAILRDANLNRVNLSLADMRSAILQGATLQQADLSGANLTGADLTRADLTDAIFGNTFFVSDVPVDFPGDMTYRDFLANLSNQDCVDGTFLLQEDGTLAPSVLSVTDNLGRRFYNSGAWRNAVSYLCAADFSGATLRNLEPVSLYWAGVDLSQADLRFMNLREAVLEDVIQVDGLEYPLEADLTGVTYDLEFTTWPPDFVPPPNTPREEEQPEGGVP
jgi:uncharacterized protein YjbI with pentapeptide repeats